MDEQIKKEMEKLRCDGMGYKRIAKKLNLSVNTISSYFQRKNKTNYAVYCINCGYRIKYMNKIGRKKKFCSKKCRISYYKHIRKYKFLNI